ncbi:MAG: POTRA domain-containing protein [Bacteroidota bacterium]|jgi:outer membrane protein assembly factor BamA|nr:MAG: hypothetical protein DIU61_14985 [Bacteroidota bacterium]
MKWLAVVGLLLLSLPDVAAQGRRDLRRIPLPDSVQKEPDTILHINRIFVVGNRLTRDHIILRELTLKEGDTVSLSRIDQVISQDEKKLFNTHLFNIARIRKLPVDKTTIDLLVDVDERWYTFPSPIFELSDRNFTEWWQNYDHDFTRINYGLRLYQFNVRGRNETLTATMQFGFNRVFAVRYTIPYIDRKQKHGLIFDFEFQESKNIAYRTLDHKRIFHSSRHLLSERRTFGLTYTFRNSFYERHYLSVDYRLTTVDDSVRLLNPDYLGNERLDQDFLSLEYQFSSDHRDVIAYPLNGYHLLLGARKLGFGFDVDKTELTASYAIFLPVGKKYYLSNYSYAYWSSPDTQPYNQLGVLGFRKEILRGYEIFVIEGPQYLLNKTTFKKEIFSRTYHWARGPIEQFRHVPIALYLKTYADLGYVWNYPDYEANSRLTNKLLVGTGAGLDLVTAYDVVLRFEYTFNGEGESGFFLNVKKEF